MKIGTHNSMSYLRPKKWYMYPFLFIAKCQSKTIEEQYEKYGVRLFDIRVYYDKCNHIEFRHGLISFIGDVKKTLEYLNSRGDKVYVRLLLESQTLTPNEELQERLFIMDCVKFQDTYKNITFFCGRRKFDWSIVFSFKYKEPKLIQKVSSMCNNPLLSVWPWLYAKLNNRSTIKDITKRWLLIDFINIK